MNPYKVTVSMSTNKFIKEALLGNFLISRISEIR